MYFPRFARFHPEICPFGNENAIPVPVSRKKMPFGNENAIFVPVWLGEAAVLQKESLPVWVLVQRMAGYGRKAVVFVGTGPGNGPVRAPSRLGAILKPFAGGD
jgi:hypothetical protein